MVVADVLCAILINAIYNVFAISLLRSDYDLVTCAIPMGHTDLTVLRRYIAILMRIGG